MKRVTLPLAMISCQMPDVYFSHGVNPIDFGDLLKLAVFTWQINVSTWFVDVFSDAITQKRNGKKLNIAAHLPEKK